MNKEDVINFFGGRKAYLARAVGITPAAIQQWSDVLPKIMQDRVIAAAVRARRIEEFLERFPTVMQENKSIPNQLIRQRKV